MQNPYLLCMQPIPCAPYTSPPAMFFLLSRGTGPSKYTVGFRFSHLEFLFEFQLPHSRKRLHGRHVNPAEVKRLIARPD